MRNHNLLIVLSSVALSVLMFGGFLYFYQTKNVSAQTECPANSHLSGSQCICDSYYKPESGECVAMTDLELCGEHAYRDGDQCWCDEGYGRLNGVGDCVPESSGCPANSHWTGEDCACDNNYKAENGGCVPMTDAERCSIAHSHPSGDQCYCDEGYVNVDSKCISNSAFCATYHAHFDSAKKDCECDKGYVENDTHDNCVPVSANTNANTNKTTTVNTNTTKPSIINVNAALTNTSVPQETAPDPADVVNSMENNPNIEFSYQPIIDASSETATKAEIKMMSKETQAINSFEDFNDGEVKLSYSEKQKMNLVNEFVNAKLEADMIKWEVTAEAKEIAGDVKDKKDKDKYEKLVKQEEGILQQIRDNQDALEVMQMQMVEYANNDQPWASTIWRGNKKYETEAKVDFMKQTNGDPHEALVNVSLAISAQYKLLGGLKDKLKDKKEEKRSLLDIPPQPDREKEMARIKTIFYP